MTIPRWNHSSRQVQSLTGQQRRWLKRRQAVEPAIGHLKSDHPDGSLLAPGTTGDALHAVLCATGQPALVAAGYARLGLGATFCARFYCC
ncbi:MAG: hypothetical protein IPL05_15180 [Betaproteobacteria bacterium]|nr:hypothetical protein [Betaproteobacteria bacterium]